MFPATPPPRARRRMTRGLLQLALIIIGLDVVHAHRVFLRVDCLVKSDHASALGDVRLENIIPSAAEQCLGIADKGHRPSSIRRSQTPRSPR
ncbi:hypothetical protein DPMN_010882 [Dreissena polymorpha]|uniref:Uncharacterized protein n=1 Tax=Dreissena polymorpha TaxID=45954 RepID=A0A9D4N3Y8_DREPO|nr:hypothetical protein DPMN_010882 [Dreissena polymorpha]